MSRDYEDLIHLRGICQLNLRGRQVGAYLLSKRNRYALRFGFTFPGVHPMVVESSFFSTLKAWNEGLRGFPPNEIIRIHQRSISDSSEREAELEFRAEGCSENAALAVLNYHQQRHTAELSEQGKRCLYQNHIFVSWSYQPGASAAQDWLENWLGQLAISFSEAYLTFKGEKTQEQQEMLKDLLTKGFDESFLHWEQQLNTRMGLKTVPMQGSALWEYAWREFNLTEGQQIPHLITATEIDGKIEIEEKIANKLCPASVLIRGENGRPSVPGENFHWLKVKGQYVAAVVLEEKLDGYADEEHQFKFFWLPFLEIPNCELVWEGKISNSTFDNINLQRTLKYQKSISQYSSSRGGHSIVADEEIKDSLAAQKKIFQGDRTVSVSVVFFLTGNTPRELDVACQRLTNLFPQGKLIRDTDIVPELWRNKQPFMDIKSRLVGSLRRHTYLSSDISLPVLTTKSFDSQGMEFITKDGGQPVYIDAQTQHHNELTIARTRKGKSTKLAEQIFTDLSYGVPSLMLDFGMASGRTTCSDLVDFLGPGGANVEVAHTNYNIIQTPNLLGLAPEIRKRQELTFLASLLSSLETLVLGDERGTRLAKRVRSVLDALITMFFQDPQNQARYEAAHRKGLGSAEWLEMPTLPDFRNFAANLDLPEIGGDISAEARDEIVMMLTNFIRSPFGQSFSRPSQLKFDAPFLNFSLRGARNEDEVTLIGTVAQTIAITRALEHVKSSVRVDEGSILLEKPSLVQNTAEMVVNGGKSGISVSILAQDIASIANCPAGSKLLTNTDIKMIGSIDESDVNDLSHYLKKPPELFYVNAKSDFDPDPINLCSHWLMLAEGTLLYLSHYPSPELMALVASNPQEQQARQRYFDTYADPIEAISVFSLDYQNARLTGIPMSELTPPINNGLSRKNFVLSGGNR